MVGLSCRRRPPPIRGPRHHAQGQYDTTTASYKVVEGDDLDAIAERLASPWPRWKEQNKLSSNEIEIGQQLVIPAGTSSGAKVEVTGVLGSPQCHDHHSR